LTASLYLLTPWASTLTDSVAVAVAPLLSVTCRPTVAVPVVANVFLTVGVVPVSVS
jgi:hypothetical protein